MRIIVKVSLIIILTTVLVNYLLPLALGQRAVVYCSDKISAQGIEACATVSLGYGNLQLTLQQFGLFLAALIFGILLVRSKRNKEWRQHLTNVVSLLGFVCIMAAIEMLFFRPAVMINSSTGVIYPKYELNMAYVMMITFWPLCIGVAGYILSGLVKMVSQHRFQRAFP
jgi:hypothetical protein